jgi:hypothetical protein
MLHITKLLQSITTCITKQKKLTLFMPLNHMGEVEVQLHSFLTLAQGGGE